ncbi:MAG: hypothetical protein IBX61_01540 [Thermoleophilia bacterium]|nr:hypothetical protein [Thermoleophilia bacterium]
MYLLANTLRENQEEVIRRWLDNLNGIIAEDFEQMLKTSMGTNFASGLLSLTIAFFEAEEYQRTDVLRRVRSAAQETSYRRSAVGFGLPDIISTGMALRRALEETLINHLLAVDSWEENQLLQGILTLNRLGDAFISGEIAGYFAYHDYHDREIGNSDVV